MLADFVHRIAHWRGQNITVALSGGVDSVVLLHLCVQAQSIVGFQSLSAVHIHHGLNSQADDWASHCQKLCLSFGVPLQIAHVDVNLNNGLGLEAAARQARQAVFQGLPCDVLALAHHADDQVETFILGALRGGGLRALSAMPVERDFFNKKLARPLLHISRTAIEQHAQQHQLPFVHDTSNDNTDDILRNWVRLQALPHLRMRLAHADKQLLSSIKNLQEELALLNEIVHDDQQTVYQATGKFNCIAWSKLSETRRKQQLLQFCRNHHLGTPRPQSVNDFAQTLSRAPTQSAQWSLPLGKAFAYRAHLYALPHGWQQQIVYNIHAITWQQQEWGLTPTLLSKNLLLRPVQKSDQIHCGSFHPKIHKILQQQHIPPFLRPLYPVLIDADTGECLAVPNIRINSKYAQKNAPFPHLNHLKQWTEAK